MEMLEDDELGLAARYVPRKNIRTSENGSDNEEKNEKEGDDKIAKKGKKAGDEKSGEVDEDSSKETLPSFKHLTGHIKRVIYAAARSDKTPVLYVAS